METNDVLYWIFSVLITAGVFCVGAYYLRKAKPWIRGVVFGLEVFLMMLFAYLFECVVPQTPAFVVALVELFFADIIVSIIEFVIFLATRKAKVTTIFKVKVTVQKFCVIAVAAIALITTFGIGYNSINQIVRQDYTIKNDKINQDKTIVFMSDIHYGKAQNVSSFETALKNISIVNPDCLILGGDIIDDFTFKDNMKKCVDSISKVKTKNGIYLALGNHEYRASNYCEDKDKFTTQDFIDECNSKGIKVLKDEVVKLDDDVNIVGRDDLGSSSRKADSDMAKQIDTNKYNIFIDHQPFGWDKDREIGADLCLSGHYHGGQIWPLRLLSDLIGNYTYGLRDKDGHKLITTSGVSAWQYPIRTDSQSEVVVVNLTK